jgi:hypothetical protein
MEAIFLRNVGLHNVKSQTMVLFTEFGLSEFLVPGNFNYDYHMSIHYRLSDYWHPHIYRSPI